MKKVICAGLLGLTATAASANYQLIYDATDGSLSIDTAGQQLLVYIINSNGNAFIDYNHTPIPGNPGVGGDPEFFFTSTPNELSDTNPVGWNAPGPYNIGTVLAPGLSLSQLNNAIATAHYVNAYGTLESSSSYLDFQLVTVPEPTSIGIMALGGALLLKRRRRAV